MTDLLDDHLDDARRLAMAQRRARVAERNGQESERIARELHLENVILRHMAGKAWYWHLGCAVTTLAEHGVERLRRVLDGPGPA